MLSDSVEMRPCQARIREWARSGLIDGLESTLAELDFQFRSEGRSGCVDESLATFDTNERWIAHVLANEGHTVIALPISTRPRVKSADACVSGLLTEFKTYSGVSARCLSNKVNSALQQADRVVIRVDGGLDDQAAVRHVFDAKVRGSGLGRLRALKFIGVDFHLEWGSWNRHFEPVYPPSCDPIGLLTPQRRHGLRTA